MTVPAEPALVLVGAALLGGPLAAALPGALRRLGLERTNYEGQPIGTGGGLLFLVAALPWLYFSPPSACAVCGFGLLGLIDDRWGSAEFKGLRGHFKAVRQGRLTTGVLKALLGAALAVALALWVRPGWPALAAAPLIALSANLFNLLDLRPLRALKAFWLLALPLLLGGGPVLWQTAGLSLPYALQESRRRVMLGDTGANLLGGLLGVAGAAVLPVWVQLLGVAVLLAFHAWAEKHSLSRWIEDHPWAAMLDRMGAGAGNSRPPGDGIRPVTRAKSAEPDSANEGGYAEDVGPEART